MTKKVTVSIEGREYIVEVGDLSANPVRAVVNQKEYKVNVPQKAASNAQAKTSSPPPRVAQPTVTEISADNITSPMPGNIIAVEVKAGDTVSRGDVLCVLEAMKMKNVIHSPRDGVIKTVDVAVGQEVEYNALLVSFE